MPSPILTRDEMLELVAHHDVHSVCVEILSRLEIDEWDLALASWDDGARDWSHYRLPSEEDFEDA